MNEWISVKERLPGVGERRNNRWKPHGVRKSIPILARFDFEDGTTKVLATKLRTSLCGFGYTLGWNTYDARYFTHWMPVPELLPEPK